LAAREDKFRNFLHQVREHRSSCGDSHTFYISVPGSGAQLILQQANERQIWPDRDVLGSKVNDRAGKGATLASFYNNSEDSQIVAWRESRLGQLRV